MGTPTARVATTTDAAAASGFVTHEVTNQPPPLEGYNLFTTDRVLDEALARAGGAWSRDGAVALGAELGGAPLAWGRLANVYAPLLRTHDRWGRRIAEVEFHPAWH